MNLLPPTEKQALTHEKRVKMAMVLGSTGIVALSCLALMLLALYFFALTMLSIQDELLAQKQYQFQAAGFADWQKSIQSSNKSITVVNHFYQTAQPASSLLTLVSSIDRPAGVQISGITMARQDGITTVTVTGTSDTRDNLLAFKSALEKTASIKNVAFPIEVWLKPSNISYTVSFDVVSQ